jgi:hypothetical protein
MSEAKPKRRFWQFHLITLVLLTLAASLLVWLNLPAKRAWGPASFYYEIGWPQSVYHYPVSIGPWDVGTPDALHSVADIIFVDLGIAMSILFNVAFTCEYLIRRREARKT